MTTEQLLTRAVARERAAWKAAIKALQREHAAGMTRCVDAAEYDHAYRLALDDLLQRRGERGGKK